MLLFIEKVAQYRGDTSITNKVHNMNNRINIKYQIKTDERLLVLFACLDSISVKLTTYVNM